MSINVKIIINTPRSLVLTLISMQFKQKAIIILFLGLIAGLTLVSSVVHLLTESWWFETVGFAGVFWQRVSWQVSIWLGTFALYGGFLSLNYWLALRLTGEFAPSAFWNLVN